VPLPPNDPLYFKDMMPKKFAIQFPTSDFPATLAATVFIKECQHENKMAEEISLHAN
jgi:hypothetical protein